MFGLPSSTFPRVDFPTPVLPRITILGLAYSDSFGTKDIIKLKSFRTKKKYYFLFNTSKNNVMVKMADFIYLAGHSMKE